MKVGFRVVLRFLLDQNDQKVLLQVRALFGFGCVTFRKDSEACYRYTAEAFTRLQPIEDYFKAFPLRKAGLPWSSPSPCKWRSILSQTSKRQINYGQVGLKTI